MLVERQGIEAVVDAHAGVVGERDGTVQVLAVESAALGTQREGAAAQVDGVGAVEHGGFQLFAASGGSEEFR